VTGPLFVVQVFLQRVLVFLVLLRAMLRQPPRPLFADKRACLIRGGHAGRREQPLQILALTRLTLRRRILRPHQRLEVHEREERREWERLRTEHLAEIREAFAKLDPGKRVILFCHDPTALPFLSREEKVRGRLSQIEQTIIGHLHSPLILWQSRLLAGMPRIGFLGHTAKRLSTALREARHWKPFNVRLCPALAGIELLKDGGYLSIELDPDGGRLARFQTHRLDRARK